MKEIELNDLSEKYKQKIADACIQRADRYSRKAADAKNSVTGLLSFMQKDKSVPIQKLAQAYINLWTEIISRENAEVLTSPDINALCSEPQHIEFLKKALHLLPAKQKAAVEHAINQQPAKNELYNVVGC